MSKYITSRNIFNQINEFYKTIPDQGINTEKIPDQNDELTDKFNKKSRPQKGECIQGTHNLPFRKSLHMDLNM